MDRIGITEAGDPVFDDSWVKWVYKDKPAILITKNIKLLFEQYPDILTKNVIIHASITGMGGSFIESNVPKPKELIEFLHNIKDKSKIVIRIDPIIPLEMCVKQAKHIMEELSDFARFRVSILDLYPHVRDRFSIGFMDQLRKIYGDKYIHSDCALRKSIIEFMGNVEVCAEPGIECTGCISQQDLDILNIQKIENEFRQREYCVCLGNKYELLKTKKQCPHGCLYCYWKD
jgi:DNA repair photolyase